MITPAFQRRLVDVGFAILIAGALFHFGHSAVQGQSGLFVNLAVETETKRLASQRDDLSAERAELENLTKRLSANYLDLDLLDERARDVLGYVRPDEVVLP
jgi:cell division protein FtsB